MISMAASPAYAPGPYAGAGLLAHVSALYYLDGRTQADIAQRLCLSRAKVSRLLRAARDAGIARIVVSPPQGSMVTLETELETRFALSEVRIVPLSLGESPDVARRQIGIAAAADLARSARAGQTVGLAGTGLVASMVEAVAPMFASDVRVIQAVGWDDAPPRRTLMGLVFELARRIGGTAVVLPVPSVVESVGDRLDLESDPQVGVALAALDSLETLYTEVAPPASDAPFAHERGRAVGRLALRHFDRRGRMLGTAVDGHVVGLTIDQLRGARHVVALAHGPAEAAIIAAAMRTRLVGTLITDERTARAIAALPFARDEADHA
jgi:DNA-binding transcriptional regulator LsrR (DeoR family)